MTTPAPFIPGWSPQPFGAVTPPPSEPKPQMRRGVFWKKHPEPAAAV